MTIVQKHIETCEEIAAHYNETLSPIRLLKDCEVGGIYMMISSRKSATRVELVQLNKTGAYGGNDSELVGATVKFLDKNQFGTDRISAGTEVYDLNESLLNKILKVQNKTTAKEKEKTKEQDSSPKRLPRSVTIDAQLAIYAKQGIEPDFEKIADAVIAIGSASDKTKSNVISQAKQRHKWYTVDGKTNPQLA